MCALHSRYSAMIKALVICLFVCSYSYSFYCLFVFVIHDLQGVFSPLEGVWKGEKTSDSRLRNSSGVGARGLRTT